MSRESQQKNKCVPTMKITIFWPSNLKVTFFKIIFATFYSYSTGEDYFTRTGIPGGWFIEGHLQGCLSQVVC